MSTIPANLEIKVHIGSAIVGYYELDALLSIDRYGDLAEVYIEADRDGMPVEMAIGDGGIVDGWRSHVPPANANAQAIWESAQLWLKAHRGERDEAAREARWSDDVLAAERSWEARHAAE